MKKSLILAGVFAIAVATAAVAAINVSGPSKEQLESDIADVRQRILAAQADAEDYKVGSPIRLQHEYRLATLRNTEAMLDQKRLSWLRGIELTYQLKGTAQVVSPEVIAQLQEDLEEARTEVAIAESKAQTAGGLMRSFALVEAATRQMTVAAVEQKLLLAKYGIHYPEVPLERRRPEPLGTKTNDKEAL